MPASLVELSKAIVEQTSQGIWVLDPDDRTSFVNGRMAELLGHSRAEMLGKPVDEFLDAAGKESAHAALARRRQGLAELREMTLHRPDGTVVHVLIESSPLFDSEGRYAGAVGMFSDITQRKQVEREVAMLATLVQSSKDAIVSCSIEGTVQSWNPAAEHLFGWTARDIVGRSLAAVLAEGENRVLRILDTAVADGVVGPNELEAVSDDGTVIPIELIASPVDDGGGRVTSIAVTMRDLRERLETERLIRDIERARLEAEREGRLGTFEWNLQTNDVVWSEEAWRLHGREPSRESPRHGYTAAVHEDDRAALQEAAMVAAQGELPLDVCYRIIHPDGQIRWIHARGTPTRKAGAEAPVMVGTLRDVTELIENEATLREARAELRRQSLHDPVTALPNRTLLLDRLALAGAHAARNHCGVAVIVLDIDRFGLVNEELGQEVGDKLLKAVGQRLAALMRGGDTVGRLSGDEFAVVCEGIEPDRQTVDALSARVVDAFGEPFVVGAHQVYLAATAGAAWAESAEPANALLAHAESALQSAKDRERGSFVVAVCPGNRTYAGHGRLALRQALRDAQPQGQLRVVYQPIVALTDGVTTALEALLRWDHPGLGPVSPLEFIPVAEDTGLILPIGEWVLNEACRTLAQIDPSISVTVNLSARQLLQPDLDRVVKEALAANAVDPDRLVLELTESMLAEESARVEDMLRRLKQVGVRLALDDFGTGYSALGYLKRFPFDIVKIDRSFIRRLGEDAEDSAIVGAVVGMATALSMELVAEGIENDTQVGCLTDLGVKWGQGFHFARPGAPPIEKELSEPPRTHG